MSNSASEVWLNSLSRTILYGEKVSSRNGDTRELLNQSFVVNMQLPFVAVEERALSYRFMASEALWTLSGSNMLNFNESIMRTYAPWAEHGMVQGAYGPKFMDQAPYIIEVLNADLFTRQAVLSIWHDRPRANMDIPCTITMQYMARDGRLHAFVNMRSNDAWLGRPNDWSCFSILAAAIMLKLRELGHMLNLGNLYVNVASSHIYEKDVEDAQRCLDNPRQHPNELFIHDNATDLTLTELMLWLNAVANQNSKTWARTVMLGGMRLK